MKPKICLLSFHIVSNKNCTSFTNIMQMIFNVFFKDFPLDCQKYMYHQKTRTSAF